MKQTKSILILGVIVVSAIFLSTSSHATIMSRLELFEPVISPGDAFEIGVFVDGVDFGTEVVNFGFDVDYNASEFFFNGASVNSPTFFDDSGFFANTDVAGSVFPGPGPSGDNILLATLGFTSLLAGNFTIGIISDLNDLNEGLGLFSMELGPLPAEDITTSIQVNPVPEPATIMLLASGLAGLGVFGRKKFRNTKA